MPSLMEVAKLSGVSVSTVSMVLNRTKRAERISDECAQRVREAARKLGYVPNYHARSMKLGVAETIGLSVEIEACPERGSSELADLFFASVIGSVELRLRREGYMLSIVGPGEKTTALARGRKAIQQRRFDGLLVLGVSSFINAPLPEDIEDEPIVVIEYPGSTTLPVIDFDDEQAVDLAVDHLLELGHRRLMWVGPDDDPSGKATIRRDRLRARAQEAGGTSVEQCLYQSGADVWSQHGEHIVDAAEQAVESCIARRGASSTVTGVVCWNDATALGVSRALQRAGRSVPGDVSVVGMDNFEAGLGCPKLTTIDHRAFEMGFRAAELLLEIAFDGDRRAELRGHVEKLAPRLIVRDSTGPAPGG
jgi:LacI family transcriptional regulator